jgi:hypothetical protein
VPRITRTEGRDPSNRLVGYVDPALGEQLPASRNLNVKRR